jgi:tetratricopeptide (TPR) repeat protein
MESLLPQTYLLGLLGLRAIVAVVVGRQLLRVRRDEQNLIRLEQADAAGSRDAGDLYELASVQLRKRLYPQATATLRQAVKRLGNEPQEARALIQNALGFSLAAQKDFSTAIRHYKSALQAKADYPVALNNLAFAEERLLNRDAACELYRKVLKLEPDNQTAKKRLKRLERAAKRQLSSRSEITPTNESPESPDGRGF